MSTEAPTRRARSRSSELRKEAARAQAAARPKSASRPKLSGHSSAFLTATRRFFRVLGVVLSPALKAVGRVVRPVLSVVTPVGWVVLGLGVVAMVLSAYFGWQEFTFVGTVLLAAFLISAVFLVGRASYGVFIELNPKRVVVGDRAMGRMVVTNTGSRRLQPSRMELPVGKGFAEFQLPAMASGEEHEELFAVPTSKRAVIVAGPAVSVKGDSLGLLRRAIRWAEAVDLFVHPRTVRLTPSAAGLVRDLEGQVSKKITNNDIAFHALRPYVPGDDRRYVHWRTSARIGQLMVRQFEETRRSQLTMIHATRDDLYASEEEFELAISVTASIAAQVIADGTQMNVVSETGTWRTATPTQMLDSSSRLEPVGDVYSSMREFARQTTRRLPPPSVVMIVAGSRMSTAEFRSIQSLFGADTSQVAFHIVAGAEPKFAAVAGLTIITVGSLDDLPKVMRGVAP